jgi:hypothetical protein
MRNGREEHLITKNLKKDANVNHLRRSAALCWLGVRKLLAFGKRTSKAADLKITQKPQRAK